MMMTDILFIYYGPFSIINDQSNVKMTMSLFLSNYQNHHHYSHHYHHHYNHNNDRIDCH